MSKFTDYVRQRAQAEFENFMARVAHRVKEVADEGSNGHDLYAWYTSERETEKLYEGLSKHLPQLIQINLHLYQSGSAKIQIDPETYILSIRR